MTRSGRVAMRPCPVPIVRLASRTSVSTGARPGVRAPVDDIGRERLRGLREGQDVLTP